MRLNWDMRSLRHARSGVADMRAFRPLAKLAGVSAALMLAGCAAQQPQSLGQHSTTGKYNGKYGVVASPRVVADGQPVPQGGGNYMVGKPYTIAGKTYYPSANVGSATGTASWYGADFHGRKTANGEIFDKSSYTAAHPTMPLPSYARVTNLRNNSSIIVRVNDRGPYHGGRVMDVSERVADALDFKQNGTARVKVDYIQPASLKGTDNAMLLASLRRDGSPASLDGSMTQPTLFAQVPPAAQPALVRRAPVVVAQVPAAQALPPRVAPVLSDALPEEPVATSSVPRSPHVDLARAPVPPSRPFDLGTIPGAGVPIAAARPKPGTEAHASLASYYVSTPISLSDHFEAVGPFEGLKPQVLHRFRSLPD